jgi:hypothetical protein
MKSKKDIDALTRRLQEVETAITETKKRLPAHSTKPPVMMDLLALEDEYHEVSSKIKSLKESE